MDHADAAFPPCTEPSSFCSASSFFAAAADSRLRISPFADAFSFESSPKHSFVTPQNLHVLQTWQNMPSRPVPSTLPHTWHGVLLLFTLSNLCVPPGSSIITSLCPPIRAASSADSPNLLRSVASAPLSRSSWTISV